MTDKELARQIAYGWYQFYINAGTQKPIDDYRKEHLQDWIVQALTAVRAEAKAGPGKHGSVHCHNAGRVDRADASAAAKREVCAKVADDFMPQGPQSGVAIRARAETEQEAERKLKLAIDFLQDAQDSLRIRGWGRELDALLATIRDTK